MNILIIIKIFLLSGLALWIMIAGYNNIVDRKTNQFLLKQLFSMQLLHQESKLGQGLLYRTVAVKKLNKIMLATITSIQMVIAFFLWLAVIMLFLTLLHKATLEHAIIICNIALLLFMLLWLFFLCGGLWYGYWIKTGQIQMLHFTLLIVSLLSIIIINLLVL